MRIGPLLAAIGRYAAACVLGLGVLTDPAGAQVKGHIEARAEAGFGRLVLAFEEPVGHEISAANGVLVVTFDHAVTFDSDELDLKLPAYVSATRLDPEGRSLRFALAQPLEANTIPAAERIFLDLLPATWRGPPPGLPQEVVDELVARAQEARRAARKVVADAASPPITVQAGRYPTFSRISLAWKEPTGTELARRGDQVTVTFDRAGFADVARLNADPPPGLVRASTSTDRDGRLVVALDLAAGTDVRGFREKDAYIVDLDLGPPRVASEAAASLGGALGASGPPIAGEGAGAGAEATPRGDSSGELVELSVTPLELGAEEQPAAEAAASQPPERKATAVPDEPDPARIDQAAVPADGEENAVVEVRARTIGSTLRLEFPFRRQVAAAVFQRGSDLWLVFDSRAAFELSALDEVGSGIVEQADVSGEGDTRIVRLRLASAFLTTADAQAERWVVSIGDLVLDPTEPLKLKRASRTDGLAKVVVAMPGAARVHWLDDAAFDDRLAVVTSAGSAHGMIKTQEFVEFTALATAQGLAIRPRADDLAVRLVQDEVVITREQGLIVSGGEWPTYVAGEAVHRAEPWPGFLDFESWRGSKSTFRQQLQALQSEVATLPPAGRAAGRLELARLLLANRLGAEALAVLYLAATEQPEIENNPAFRAMRGVARLWQGRLAPARDDLAAAGLHQDPHAALWRGMVETASGRWREALGAFEQGEVALEAYPPSQQRRFRMAAAEAALMASDLTTARLHLDAAEDLDASAARAEDAQREQLLRARLAERVGEAEKAFDAFGALAAGAVRPVAAEAELRHVRLGLRDGRVEPASALARLERLAVAWRGDDVELGAMRELARLYTANGRYRDALATMKTAIIEHDENALTRLIGDDMSRLFADLFLDGAADTLPPVEALGLYYDYKELTPVGHHGDEMIRKLARRLVGVDLLDQAGELLSYQVNSRLSGAARAQVAAELAMIRLRAHQPELALNALHVSRQSVLPATLERQRNILEAQALAELGRVGVAVELLDTMTGDEVERIKADALWHGKRWQDAGEQIERVLGERWQGGAPLSDDERFDVMRAGIAFAMSSDELALDRLRRKFAAKMADSPDAAAFDLITANAHRGGLAFQELAREIASVDTLDRFLDEFNLEPASKLLDGGAG